MMRVLENFSLTQLRRGEESHFDYFSDGLEPPTSFFQVELSQHVQAMGYPTPIVTNGNGSDGNGYEYPTLTR